jgi:hypothetical protein
MKNNRVQYVCVLLVITWGFTTQGYVSADFVDPEPENPIQTECLFPDKDFFMSVAIDVSLEQVAVEEQDLFRNVDYQTGCVAPWLCNSMFTGATCNRNCTYGLECPIATRESECIPPLDSKCVPCQQDTDEALNGRYSFDKYERNNMKYDLMKQIGSFEYSKVYTSRGHFIRNAVNTGTRTKTELFVPWNDVLFFVNYSPLLTFWGVGKIDLHHSNGMGLGAMKSEVFLQLSAPFAKLAVCDLETGYNLQSIFGVQHRFTEGLVYEFNYRQRLPFTDPIIFTANFVSHKENLDLPTKLVSYVNMELPSVDVWTRKQGFFDYTDRTEGVSVPETGCIELQFEMLGYNELLIDNFRVFSNIIGNSGFNTPYGVADSKWTRRPTSSNAEVPIIPTWDGTAYAVIYSGSLVEQSMQLRIADTANSIVAAMLSIKVRGNCTFYVRYSTTSTDVADYHNVPIYLNLKDSPLAVEEWRVIKIPFTMKVYTPMQDTHYIRVGNVGGGTEVLHVDDVVIYVDDHRCPILECDEPTQNVFVNGQCEPCGQSETTCPLGRIHTGCFVEETGITQDCSTTCPSPIKDQGAAQDVDADGEWKLAPEECTWQCFSGFWYSRELGLTDRPMCKTCTPLAQLSCHVGWYAVACTDENDAKCVPCDILDRYDNSVVYTSEYDKSMYTLPPAEQCTHACSPGQFQYGVRTDNGIAMCFPCTTSICGAQDTGVSALRMLNGPQYTSSCTATQDSQCKLCESIDSEVLFTTNGGVMADWCAYGCAPGSTPCGTCNWDPYAADIVQFVGTDGVNANIMFDLRLMVRLQGDVIINTTQFDTKMQLNVYLIAHVGNGVTARFDIGTVLKLFPVVPPSALNIQELGSVNPMIVNAPVQHFDVTVQMRDFTNSEPYSNWIGTVVGNSASVFFGYEILKTDEMIQLSHFSASTQMSVSGCCEARDPNSLQLFDPQVIPRCSPCTVALGLTGYLPTNAHWVGGEDCSWECDEFFEIWPGGDTHLCQECNVHTCPSGQYWTECGECETCTTPPTNAVFVGQGITRRDSDSCPIKCNPTFYLHEIVNTTECVRCTSSTQLDCTNVTKTKGDFFELACSDTQDAICVNCLICKPGENASTPCGAFNDAVCTRCDTSLIHMPPATVDGGAEWRLGKTSRDYCAWGCANGMQHNIVANTCFTCHDAPCAIGNYPVPCTQYNNYTGCKRCLLPENATVISSGMWLQNNSCVWECRDNLEYNATLHACLPPPVVELASINAPPVASYCSGTKCGWGMFFDTAFDLDPCSAMCSACPPLPTQQLPGAIAVYTRKGSCDWVCAFPHFLQGGQCVSVPSNEI